MAETESKSTSMDDKYPPLPEEGIDEPDSITGISPRQIPGIDEPDSITGISPRQARAVLVSWDLVRPNMKQHGINFFIKLFKTHPPIQKYFKGMATLNEEELKKSKRLAAHAHTVMLNISGIVDNLDDVETLGIILEKIGKSHKKRGVQQVNFKQLQEVLIVFLSESLGDHFTDVAKEGWNGALGAMVKSITQVYENEDED